MLNRRHRGERGNFEADRTGWQTDLVLALRERKEGP